MSETEFQHLNKADKDSRVVVECANSIEQRAHKNYKKYLEKSQK